MSNYTLNSSNIYGYVSSYSLNNNGTAMCNINNSTQNITLFSFLNVYNIKCQNPPSTNQVILLSIDNKYVFSNETTLDYNLIKTFYDKTIPDAILFESVHYYSSGISNAINNIYLNYDVTSINDILYNIDDTIPDDILILFKNMWDIIRKDKVCLNIMSQLIYSDHLLSEFQIRLAYLISYDAVLLNFDIISHELPNTKKSSDYSNLLEWSLISKYYLYSASPTPVNFCYEFNTPSSNINACSNVLYGDSSSGLQLLKPSNISFISHSIFLGDDTSEDKINTFFSVINGYITSQSISQSIAISDSILIKNLISYYTGINEQFDKLKPFILLTTVLNPLSGNQKIDISQISSNSNILIALNSGQILDFTDETSITRISLNNSSHHNSTDVLRIKYSSRNILNIQQNNTFDVNNKRYKFVCAGNPIIINQVEELSEVESTYEHLDTYDRKTNTWDHFINRICFILLIGIIIYFLMKINKN